MNKATATVEVLTAEVRALMVGSRQVTLSVFKQLDIVPSCLLMPMGRVNLGDRSLWLVGRKEEDGVLARANWTAEVSPGSYRLVQEGKEEQWSECPPKPPYAADAEKKAQWKRECQEFREQENAGTELLLRYRRRQKEVFTALPLIVLAGLR